MTRQLPQSLDLQQQKQQLQDQQQQQQLLPTPTHLEDSNSISKPITLTLSRFSRDCNSSVVFSLKDTNPTTIASSNSIYIPKQYRVPVPGQRQSSPGECDLVLKIFPRLAFNDIDPESIRSQGVISPCDKCKSKKRDIFQIEGPDPNSPFPQRLFFVTGEVRIYLKLCCPPSHHPHSDDNYGYVLTFELHQGKRVLMSETVKNSGPGLVPEPVEMDTVLDLQRPEKRRLSSSPSSLDSLELSVDSNDGHMPRKRSMVMSLSNLMSEGSSSPNVKTDSAYSSVTTSIDPSSPTAVVPLSPRSYQHDNDESGARSRSKTLSFEDHAPSSWNYYKGPKNSKESRSGDDESQSNLAESGTAPNAAGFPKQPKKRSEPHELSELGIGQRASANLHAAYVNGQIRERSKAGLPIDDLTEAAVKPKSSSSKPKPSHACPEPDCDKSFSRLFNLRSHMRTHSKARPFVCASCNFAFSRRHDRDRHAKKHLSEKPYKCIVCEATFVRQDALVRHLRMDGVQNQCMAAMEIRTISHGETGGSYMLAAKQQVRDEQQLAGREANGDKQKAINGELIKSQLDSDDAADLDETPENGLERGEDDDDEEEEEGEGDEEDEEDNNGVQKREKDDSKAPKIEDPGNPRSESAIQRSPTFRQKVSVEYSSERQVHRSATTSRAASPHRDGPSLEKGYGHDSEYFGTPRYEKGHQEYYGEDRYRFAPHPRSYYPSPSRSHSRSHSQSQPYPMAPEFHGSSYQGSAPPPYPPPYPPQPPPYYGPNSKYQQHTVHEYPYRDSKSGYGHPNSHVPHQSHRRYHERVPSHDARATYPPYNEPNRQDYYPSYRAQDSVYDHHNENSHTSLQSWVHGPDAQSDLTELEPDKSICDAAMGLLRIQASQWRGRSSDV
ncbi:hypothetical protein BGZ76_000839 [Entomortierella beljakovae]|nr:hypothetical protein BGZ76_000839 [Entomortierella beljakovae]